MQVSHYYETLTQSQDMVMDPSHLHQYQQKKDRKSDGKSRCLLWTYPTPVVLFLLLKMYRCHDVRVTACMQTTIRGAVVGRCLRLVGLHLLRTLEEEEAARSNVRTAS